MSTYKVVKHRKIISHKEYLMVANTEKEAIDIVKGGGGIHLPELRTRRCKMRYS